MKILVLNGSPKGDQSVTLQYVHYIGQHLPHIEFKVLNVSQRIRNLEKKHSAFEELIAEVNSADCVLWAFPVYYLLVPSNYKRFIELIRERSSEAAFKGKYAAVLTTSIHVLDHIAHNYMNAICDDLEMNFTGSFSADMFDLLQPKKRRRLIQFAEQIVATIESQNPTPRNYAPLTCSASEYLPGPISKRYDTGPLKMTVVTDEKDSDTNLGRMVVRFVKAVSGNVTVVNLHDINIKGGCLGCLQCGYDNKCAYEGKDEFVPFYNDKIKSADIIVMAGTIVDRYLSSQWKCFFDRSFFNNHIPTMAGKQLGFIISGPMRHLSNLRQALEGMIEIQSASIVDITTDEYDNSSMIDELLDSMAVRLIRCAEHDYIKPATFLGIGGHKVFRDYLFSRMRFPFRKDHQYFKKNGRYNFPHKARKIRLRNAIILMLSRIPAIRKEVYVNRMISEMVKPFQQVLKRRQE